MVSPHRERLSTSDRARRRAASVDLFPGIVVLVATQASLLVADPDVSAGGATLAWALSPLIGIGLLVGAQLRILHRSDERERAEEHAAMAVGFGAVIAALGGISVLQAADIGDARQLLQLTTVLGVGSWVLAKWLLGRGRP